MFNKFVEKFCYLLATGFGLGLIPKAPGTFGSLLGIPVGVFLFHAPFPFSITFLILFSITSIFIIKEAEKQFSSHDPSAIVIDEIVGQAIPLAFIAPTMNNIILAFLFFRIFDIIKKGPVGYVDRKVGGALGVLLDDIVAGILALGVLKVIGHYF